MATAKQLAARQKFTAMVKAKSGKTAATAKSKSKSGYSFAKKSK